MNSESARNPVASGSPAVWRWILAALLILVPGSWTIAANGRWIAARSYADNARAHQRRAAGRTMSATERAEFDDLTRRTARAALQLDPVDPVTAFQAAMVLYTAGAPAEAVSAFLPKLELFPFPGPGQRLVLRALASVEGWEQSPPAVEAMRRAAEAMVAVTPRPTVLPGRLYYLAGRAFDAARDQVRATTAMLEGLTFDDYQAQIALALAILSGREKHAAQQRHFLARALREADLPGAVMLEAAGWAAGEADPESLRGFLHLARDTEGVGAEDFLRLVLRLKQEGKGDTAWIVVREGRGAWPEHLELALLAGLLAAERGDSATARDLLGDFLQRAPADHPQRAEAEGFLLNLE